MFREFRQAKGREKWPLAYDLAGVERDYRIRTQLKEQELMAQQRSENNFASGKMVDINNPVRQPYNPWDPKNEFPKMLYHPTKKHPAWQKEEQRIKLYNKLHPEKPELLPVVPCQNVVVHSKEEQARKIAEGWMLVPPVDDSEDGESIGDESLVRQGECSRGCGKAPHRGSCKGQAVVA